jgi:hypothetical protein
LQKRYAEEVVKNIKLKNKKEEKSDSNEGLEWFSNYGRSIVKKNGKWIVTDHEMGVGNRFEDEFLSVALYKAMHGRNSC